MAETHLRTLDCCPEERCFKFTPIGVCGACKLRNVTNPCIHTDKHLNYSNFCEDNPARKSACIISWKVPDGLRGPITKKQCTHTNRYKTLLTVTSKSELLKRHNVDLVNHELSIRFSSENDIKIQMEQLNVKCRHELLQYCHQQERTQSWLLTLDVQSSVALWVDRLRTVPDTLHMELRVGEELLTQVVQVYLMDRVDILSDLSQTKQLQEKQRRLCRVSEAIGYIISNNDFSNFTIECEANKPVIKKIAVNNDRLQKYMQNLPTF